jgi:hypothetical protein
MRNEAGFSEAFHPARVFPSKSDTQPSSAAPAAGADTAAARSTIAIDDSVIFMGGPSG